MSAPLFVLNDIGFAYGSGRRVLDGASLTLGPGDRVGLTGGNGAGKTTLLHLMVGLHKPDRGRLRAFGQDRVREPDFHAVRLRTGLLFQDPDDQLFSATVGEDVAFGPFNRGWSRDRVAAAVRDTLDRLGLSGYEGRVTHHLSHGEKRLVCLATILAMAPEVLLLDEPTDGLDADHAARLEMILADHPAARIIVSHDADFLARSTTRRLRLAHGRVREG